MTAETTPTTLRDREPGTAEEEPVLRLTGEQLNSIQPPPKGDWFVDWDEYEDFVPKRMLDAAREQAATEARRELLAKMADRVGAIDGTPNGLIARAEVLAAIYAEDKPLSATAYAAADPYAGTQG